MNEFTIDDRFKANLIDLSDKGVDFDVLQLVLKNKTKFLNLDLFKFEQTEEQKKFVEKCQKAAYMHEDKVVADRLDRLDRLSNGSKEAAFVFDMKQFERELEEAIEAFLNVDVSVQEKIGLYRDACNRFAIKLLLDNSERHGGNE